MAGKSELDLGAFRRLLIEEIESLEAISEGASDDRKPVDLDQQSVGRLSRMDAIQQQAMAQAVEARRRARKLRLEAALQRIDEGEFGFCLGCGDEIPADRLAIDPTTPRCVACTD